MFNSPLMPSSVGGPLESTLLAPDLLGLVVLLVPLALIGVLLAAAALRRLPKWLEVRQAWHTLAIRARLLMLDLRSVR
jgi:uncharacterized membrane protein